MTTELIPGGYEMQPREVEEFAVLDLDRTLLNTSAVTQLVLAGLARHGVAPGQIAKAIAYVEAQAGNSFQLFEYIKQEFSADTLAVLAADIMGSDALLAEIAPDLLCAGADRFLAGLDAQNVPHMVLTYGEPEFQEFKVELFRKLVGRTAEQLPAVVTGTTNKSQWVADAWFPNGFGMADVPGEVAGEDLLAHRVVVVDDKHTNLNSPDERVLGVLVDNSVARQGSTLSIADVAQALADGVSLTDIAIVYAERDKVDNY